MLSVQTLLDHTLARVEVDLAAMAIRVLTRMSARLEHTTVTRMLTAPTLLVASHVAVSKDFREMECPA